jgi:hypothetical protein
VGGHPILQSIGISTREKNGRKSRRGNYVIIKVAGARLDGSYL